MRLYNFCLIKLLETHGSPNIGCDKKYINTHNQPERRASQIAAGNKLINASELKSPIEILNEKKLKIYINLSIFRTQFSNI
jgi:hypothetical protein